MRKRTMILSPQSALASTLVSATAATATASPFINTTSNIIRVPKTFGRCSPQAHIRLKTMIYKISVLTIYRIK